MLCDFPVFISNLPIPVTALAFDLAHTEVCTSCSTKTDVCSFINCLSHCKNIRSSTEAAQCLTNTGAYPSMINSSGYKLSFNLFGYSATLDHHKLIGAPTDRNMHACTRAVSTDLCTQLLNTVPSMQRQHLPLPTQTQHFMSEDDRTSVGFLWVWTDPFHAPPFLHVILFPTQISLSPPPLSLSLQCFSTQCSTAQRLLKSIQLLSLLRLKLPQGPAIA